MTAAPAIANLGRSTRPQEKVRADPITPPALAAGHPFTGSRPPARGRRPLLPRPAHPGHPETLGQSRLPGADRRPEEDRGNPEERPAATQRRIHRAALPAHGQRGKLPPAAEHLQPPGDPPERGPRSAVQAQGADAPVLRLPRRQAALRRRGAGPDELLAARAVDPVHPHRRILDDPVPGRTAQPARLQGMQETKAAAAMLTGSALDYLGLTAQFERQDLVLYSAELAREMPELFIHLPSPVRAQLLERIAGFAKDHPYPEVRDNMRDLQPVLQAIQADVENSWRPGGTPRHRTNPWT